MLLKPKKTLADLKKKVVSNSMGQFLPKMPTVGTSNPLSLVWLLIAPPAWGKTEFLMSFPDSVLLACEEGHKLVKGYKIVIDCYDYLKGYKEPWTDNDGNPHMSLIQAVDALLDSDRFKFVNIDTVDSMVKMISDYFLAKKKAEHLEDLGQWGRGYDVGQNSPFRRIINKILKSGRGVGMTTHQEIVDRVIRNKPKVKKETTLPKGIIKLIIPQVDIALHGEFGKRRKPNRFKDRIAISEGSDEAVAKNRGGMLPNRFIVPHEFNQRWPLIESFFKDKKNIIKAEEAHDRIYGDD